MEPEVSAIPPHSIEVFEQQRIEGITPVEDSAWVALPGAEECLAVGYLARSWFQGHAGLSQLKHERAVSKTLAAIWAIHEKLGLPSKLKVSIIALLPPGEFEDRGRFKQGLQEALAKFHTPSGILNVESTSLRIRQEGAGILQRRLASKGQAIARKVIAVVMLGYRNVSLLVVRRGATGKTKTGDYGVVQMLERVQQRTSGQSLTGLAQAISEAGQEIDPRPFWRLTRGTDPEREREEVEQMQAATRAAREEYTRILLSWLDEQIPADADELAFCGGTADYLRPELSERYKFYPHTYHAGRQLPDSIDDCGMGNRLADVLGAFGLLQENVVTGTPQKVGG